MLEGRNAITFNELQPLGPGVCKLLAAFVSAGAEYLVVGDHAVRFHGHWRRARALELWIAPTAANLKQGNVALTGLGKPLTAAEQFHLAKPRAKLRLPECGVELRSSVRGLADFSAARQRADLGYVKGEGCPVLCLPDLYRTKRGSRNDQDWEDIGILSAGSAFDDVSDTDEEEEEERARL